jgi:hypothetical protein
MIVMLAGIVEEPGILAKGSLHDFLERLTLEAAAFEKIVAVIDVGEVMFVVVIF